MNPLRRRWLLALAPLVADVRAQPASGAAASGAAAADEPPDPVRRGRVLVFPRDHGAHLGARTEWWYATGWLGSADQPTHGFQVTFFRSRTGLATANPSRFAARQLLFAHAALIDLAARDHRHDQRIARWSGAALAAPGAAATHDADVRLGTWRMWRDGEAWRAAIAATGFDLRLRLARTQPLLLQGENGHSRKGPDERQASHYYSEPQLAAEAEVVVEGRRIEGAGRAWLDHEWSDEILHPDAVGWDWIGVNMFDGSALTAFVLRRRDRSTLWAGGSYRAPGQPARIFAAGEVRMLAGRRWRSAATAADYPVQWQIETPAGRWRLRALADEQELDSRASTGTVYWEGLSELLDDAGGRVGLGYLEMTGYVGALRL